MVPKCHFFPSLHPFCEVFDIQAIETAVNKYRHGDISLFEASKSVGMHPQEFINHMVELTRVKAYC